MFRIDSTPRAETVSTDCHGKGLHKEPSPKWGQLCCLLQHSLQISRSNQPKDLRFFSYNVSKTWPGYNKRPTVFNFRHAWMEKFNIIAMDDIWNIHSRLTKTRIGRIQSRILFEVNHNTIQKQRKDGRESPYLPLHFWVRQYNIKRKGMTPLSSKMEI